MRPFLIWRDDWLLGYERVDAQHLALADKLNDMHRFLVFYNNRPQAGLDQLCLQLEELIEMTRRHFHDEEALMQEHGFPGLKAHHREHAMLLAEMQECMREIEAGNRAFSLQTLTALKHWQIDHVLNSDQEFVDYLVDCSDEQRQRRSVASSSGAVSQTHLSRH